MKKTRILSLLLFILCLSSILALTSCGQDKSGNTIDEPELTAEYLSDEYSQQLLTDGAETTLGTVTITEVGGVYSVVVSEKEVVPNSDYEDGYYIADTNVVKEGTLGFDARIVCEHEGENIMSDADAFMKEHPDGSEELYTIYMMGNSAELIMITDPEEVIVE